MVKWLGPFFRVPSSEENLHLFPPDRTDKLAWNKIHSRSPNSQWNQDGLSTSKILASQPRISSLIDLPHPLRIESSHGHRRRGGEPGHSWRRRAGERAVSINGAWATRQGTSVCIIMVLLCFLSRQGRHQLLLWWRMLQREGETVSHGRA